MNIIKTLTLVLLIVLCQYSCTSNTSSMTMIIDELPKNQTEFQQLVISQLTGAKGISTANGRDMFISSRWHPEEKQVTRSYLKTLLETLNQSTEFHNYTMPNVNFGVDLLIEPLKGKNVYSILKATNPSNDYVVIGAHYDTGGINVPGAIDNGSGMALILSVFRRLQELDHRNKNVIIVFFDQEEEDISAGSRAFARFLLKSGYNIHSVHTFDLIGWDGDGNREVEIALPSTEIEQLYKKHALKLNIPIYVSKVESTDHFSFIRKGMNAHCLSQAFAKGDNSGKKDTPEDTYDLVNFDFLNSTTNLAYEAIKDILHEYK